MTSLRMHVSSTQDAQVCAEIIALPGQRDEEGREVTTGTVYSLIALPDAHQWRERVISDFAASGMRVTGDLPEIEWVEDRADVTPPA